ncbi:hypothetical protein JCM8547_005476 [Rhodosporidiobolus lusitaniae]
MRDEIRVTDLHLVTPALAPDLWQRPQKLQPLVCSLSIRTRVDAEADSDALLSESLNYGTVTKAIEAHVARLPPQDSDDGLPLEVLAEQLAQVVLFQANAPNVRLELRRPRAHLRAEAVGVEIVRSRANYSFAPSSSTLSTLPLYTLRPDALSLLDDKLFVRALRRHIIIGINACERIDEQEVIVDFEFAADDMNVRLSNGARAGWADWRRVVQQAEEHLSASGPLTIEHICTSLARLIVAPPATAPSSTRGGWNVSRTTVRVSKPSALMFAKHPGVAVTRSRGDFPSMRTFSTASSASSSATSARSRTAYLGIGTNLGERVGNLNDALKVLEELGQGAVTVRDTSFLYESEAMYHEDQAKFLNAAVKVETSLQPLPLLHLLKSVEASLGRDFTTFRNGPRVIDLDLLLYDDLVFDSRKEGGETGEEDNRWLRIPHQSISEREFVLRPLLDIAPDLQHPAFHCTAVELLADVLSSTRSTVHRVFPLSRTSVEPFSRPSCASPVTRTLVMSILNTTPDSFSDGGVNSMLPSAISSAVSHLERGGSILDVGGMSTRPGAADISVEEETDRVVPLVRALRDEHKLAAPISVDTFRPKVARAAIQAGATIVNDVYGGREQGMLETMADLAVPVVLMHSRGNPSTMTRLTDYDADGGVVPGVRREMEEMVQAALNKGVRRWNIILDPGIGFAKTAAQNYELLRCLPLLVGGSPLLKDFPVLVGLSRKRFLGPDKDAQDRLLETAAATTACVATGMCEIVRVHDTKEMVDAVRVADSIYRP